MSAHDIGNPTSRHPVDIHCLRSRQVGGEPSTRSTTMVEWSRTSQRGSPMRRHRCWRTRAVSARPPPRWPLLSSRSMLRWSRCRPFQINCAAHSEKSRAAIQRSPSRCGCGGSRSWLQRWHRSLLSASSPSEQPDHDLPSCRSAGFMISRNTDGQARGSGRPATPAACGRVRESRPARPRSGAG